MTTDAITSRLRMANPMPLVPAADDPDLLARITALPADPRLARPDRRKAVRRRRVALALAFVLLALLTSTAFAVSHWVLGDAVKPPVTRREYQRAQHQLTLPRGRSSTFSRTPSQAAERAAGMPSGFRRTRGSAIGSARSIAATSRLSGERTPSSRRYSRTTCWSRRKMPLRIGRRRIRRRSRTRSSPTTAAISGCRRCTRRPPPVTLEI